MLAGEIYDCADNELMSRWHFFAKKLQQEYNNTASTDPGKSYLATALGYQACQAGIA